MESQTDVVKIVPWDIPISASYSRANELEDLHYSGSGLRIVLVEEELGRKWELMFRSVQAFRLTSEECALQVLSSFPKPGGFFEVINSSWLQELGKDEIGFLEDSRHFIVSCYDEVIEVISAECQEKLLDSD